MYKVNYHAKLIPNNCYHVYNHAVGIENLFKQARNYDFFIIKWNQFITPYFTNYAFCLMPNHFHFLIKARPITEQLQLRIKHENTRKSAAFINNEVEINIFYESQFKRFFTSYTNSINKQEENRHGSLFKAKFKRTLIEDRERFLYYLCYIHHNPIHHGFSKNFLDWQYSSYPAYYMQTELEYLAKENVLRIFPDDSLTAFIKAHENFKNNLNLL